MRVKDHWSLSDSEFESQFANYKLKPGMFSHEAHIRLAYIHIEKYGLQKAEANMCHQIKGFAESLGDLEKFNKTVTIAAIKTVNHFMNKSKSENFKSFLVEFPRLFTDFKGLLRQHYGYNVFADKKAKEEYQEPDLLPF
ncbi:MAG: hypothetical protein ABJP45_12020 [Cyclobacteriaceae bacterium]